MSEPTTDFASLLQRARDGDERAVAEVIRHYEPELRLVAHVRLGPALRPYVDTIDLVQSVHKSLLRGLRGNRFKIAKPEELIALALTMVRRKVARQWRRNRRQERAACDAEPPDRWRRRAIIGTPTDPAQAAALADAVAGVNRLLDDAERRLVELRLAGYSTSEAARRLGEDADILRVRLSRLRRRLRDHGVLAEWL